MSDFAIAANFTSAANAAAPPAWYGLGQIENEAQSACNDPDPSRQCGSDLNRVGQSWSILSTKYHVAIPWLFDRTAGYGVFFNQPGDGAIDLSDGGLGASFVCQPQFDMWVTVAPATGPTVAPFAAVHTQYMQAVGLPAQLPDKAMYYWQSRDAYHNSTEVIALANNFSKRKLKVGVIVLDLAIAEASPYYRLVSLPPPKKKKTKKTRAHKRSPATRHPFPPIHPSTQPSTLLSRLRGRAVDVALFMCWTLAVGCLSNIRTPRDFRTSRRWWQRWPTSRGQA